MACIDLEMEFGGGMRMRNGVGDRNAGQSLERGGLRVRDCVGCRCCSSTLTSSDAVTK